MTAISYALLVLSFILSGAAILSSARLAAAVRELQDRLTPLPLSRLNSLQSSQEDLMQAVDALAQRVKMQKVRNAITHTDKTNGAGMPDPYRDPDGWRKAMNERLLKGRHGL